MKYLVVKAKGGMGNRMLCAITGILYGQLANRKIYVDWTDGVYAAPGVNAFDSFFDCSVVTNQSKPPLGSIFPDIWSGCLDKSVSQMFTKYDPDKHSSKFIHRKYSLDVRNLNYPQDVVVFWNYIDRINNLRRHFNKTNSPYADLSRAAIIRKFLSDEMMLNNDISSKIAEFKDMHWQDHVIGVHVRYTDRKSPLGNYEKPIAKLLRKYPGASIFLATDNQEIESYFQNKYGRIFTTPKWFPSNTNALHTNTECLDKAQSGAEALIDMYLLAECNGLVYPGNSTFSWIPSALLSCEENNTFDVCKYSLKINFYKLIRKLIP